MTAGTFSLVPLFEPNNFSGNFDGLEVANGKSQDLIRLPTVREVFQYNQEYAVLKEQLLSEEITHLEYVKALQKVGKATIASILQRTPEEQLAFLNSTEGVDCTCLHLEECDVDVETMGDMPCAGSSAYMGIAEHSFRMMNRGLFRPMLANSDTHDLYDEEAGMPRNYVRSSMEKPALIDTDELNRAVRKGEVVATYGPFVDFTVNGEGLGSMVKTTEGGTVELSVQVQSPSGSMWTG